MGLECDTSRAMRKLADVQRRTSDVSEIMRVGAAESRALLEQQEAQGRSPSGARWAPRVRVITDRRTGKSRARKQTGQLLRRTGLLLASLSIVASANSIEITNLAPYAKYIQSGYYKQTAHGVRSMRARALVPSKRPRVGAFGAWLRTFQRQIKAYLVSGDVRQIVGAQ